MYPLSSQLGACYVGNGDASSKEFEEEEVIVEEEEEEESSL